MLENKEKQHEEIVLRTEEIIELGLRLQAVSEILSEVKITDEIAKLLQKEIRDISAYLVFINDSDSLEYLKNY